ncbi:MAG: PHP domain-containing protein [Candidatus Methanomethylophilaceae archaeon]|nr:PHP domain-containing protein [Candidatus Methanomethylophilaceae archaeon]
MNSKVDTHVHTYFSGVSNYKVLRFPESITKPERQVECARKNGMNLLCITDHDAVKGAFEAQKYAKQYDDFEVVVGEEVTSADGEVLAYFLNELVPPGLPIEETLDIIHGQGGLAVAPHPFSFYVPCLHERVMDLDLDGIEVINGGHVDAFTNMKAQTVFKEHPGRWAPFSGSDAHSVYTTGYNWTEFEGSGAEDFYKAIVNKRTVACGQPAPPFRQVQWSVEVVLGAQKMLLKALMGRLEPDPENPLITKMLTINDPKKIGGIIGGFLYLMPPLPFIAEYLATTWLKRKSYTLVNELDTKFQMEKEQVYKICVYIPRDYSDRLMDAIDEIIDPLYPGYRRAFSITEVTGTWKPLKGSHPYIGTPGEIEKVEEHKIEFIVKENDLKRVLLKVREVHPYEEPMIDVSPTYAWKSML